MASAEKHLSAQMEQLPDGSDFRFALVVSSYHLEITSVLEEGCREVLRHAGVPAENILRIDCPGAYELPILSAVAYDRHKPDAVIALGCVVKGDTRHDEYINSAVAQGLMRLSLDHRTPFVFGLLTVENMQQAIDRAGGKYGNKGAECAETALRMLKTFAQL